MSREYQREPRIHAADRIIAEARVRVAAQKILLRRLARTDRAALSGSASVLLMTMRRTLTMLERNRARLLEEEGSRAARFVRGPATVISLAEARAARTGGEVEIQLDNDVFLFKPSAPTTPN
jgi:hypothetical protein